jgi:molybdopterin/thiamine biosynthesis adenylyltransferase
VKKNWALMGVRTAGGGRIWTTGDDQVGFRQRLLFHESNIGRVKSECLAGGAAAMNPQMRTEARAGCDDDFSDTVSGVGSAIDTFKARQQVDKQCIKHKKPLLDSGFLGRWSTWRSLCQT